MFMAKLDESPKDIIGEPRVEIIEGAGKIFIGNDSDDLKHVYMTVPMTTYRVEVGAQLKIQRYPILQQDYLLWN